MISFRAEAQSIIFLSATLFTLILVALWFPTNLFSVSNMMDSGFSMKYFLELRLTRVLATVLIGGLVAVSGYLVQALFRNPIAGPSILGVSAAGTTFAIVAILASSSTPAFLYLSLSSLGGVAFTLCVWYVLQRFTRYTIERLLLIGFSLNMLLGSLSGLGVAFSRNDPHKLRAVLSWVYGGFSFVKPYHLLVLTFLAIVSFLFLARTLDYFRLLNLGEGMAKLAGVPYFKLRGASLLLVGMIIGIICALCGNIPFLGVVSPQIARKLSNFNERFCVANCFLVGASLLVLSDLIGRSILYPEELETGIVCGMITGPIFLMIILSRGVGHARNS